MEELTTEMHSELLGHEINNLDLRVMAVYGAVSRGEKFENALKAYDLTEEQYNDNINRVLSASA
ncbi:hypothetical protein PIECOFPK_02703 [Mycovorax composti]|jgi:hypothetical protein|uniref:Uncharacterized protein n=2 Tax=Chitinophagaceae TaxID=563835 RepID=A0ABZ2EN08_9BACT